MQTGRGGAAAGSREGELSLPYLGKENKMGGGGRCHREAGKQAGTGEDSGTQRIQEST